MKRPSFTILLFAGLALLTLALLLTGCGGLEKGGVTVSSTPNRGVYPPSAIPYGKTYGEWLVEWWKWLLAIPARDNPALDETGEKAGGHQSGPVWFLAGTFGTVAERTCTVPADKALLIPIGTALFWIPVDADTVAGLRAKIAEDRTTELEMTVDGVALQGLWNFRFESPSTFFFATADLNSFFGVTGPGFEDGHPYEALAAGYLVMLEPLPVGQHTIKWRTKAVQPAIFPSVQVFELNITYHLTVE